MRAACTLLALLVAVVGSGCPRRTETTAKPCTPSTKDEVLAAIYSIFYRAAEANSSVVPREFPPLDLEDAANFLRCDPDLEVREARIRRAAIKLASGIVLLKCTRVSASQAQIGEFERALAVLEVPDTLVTKLTQGVACEDAALSNVEDIAGGIIDAEPDLAFLRRSCCACVDSCRIGPWKEASVAEFKIIVNRDSSCVLHVIDPQCWDDVVPLNFEDTFILDQTPCAGSDPVCRSASTCDTLLSPPTPMPMPPKPATPWRTSLRAAQGQHAGDHLGALERAQGTHDDAGDGCLSNGLRPV